MRSSCSFLLTLLSAALLSASGCALGPKAIQCERTKYNEALVQTNREELLLNLVRLRYQDSIGLLAVASIATQRQFGQEFTAAGDVGADAAHLLGLFGRVSSFERPTVSYVPPNQEVIRGLLNPLTTESLFVLANTGTPAEHVMRIIVKRMNNVENAVTAGGPVPETPPEFEEFDSLMRNARALAARGQLEVGRIEHLAAVADPVARDSVKTAEFRDAFEHDYVYEPAADARQVVLKKKEQVTALRIAPQALDSPEGMEVIRQLGLKPGLGQYEMKLALERRLLAEPGEGRASILIGIRSPLEILYFLSTGVEVPDDHVACGLATVTRDETGCPFDWQRVLDGTFQVQVCKRRPRHVAVSVKYRGYWFYIDDRDHQSKTTFLTLAKILGLQIRAGGAEGLPVLTLPVGG